MIGRFIDSFIPSIVSNDEEQSNIRLIISIVLITITISLAGLVLLGIPLQSGRIILAMLLIAVANLGNLALIRAGKLQIARILIPLAGFIGIAGLIATSPTGIHDVVSFALAAMVVIATITLRRTGTIAFSLLYIATLVVLSLLEINGMIVNNASNTTVFDDIIVIALAGLAFMGVMNGLVGRLNESLAKISETVKKQAEANMELRELQNTLDDRIQQRTADLETANQRNEKRARQFEAIAQVARATTTNESLEILLPRLASLVSEQFGFYHTGIFLLDENREYAVLSAANSAGGKRMLERGHKLQIGQTGMVGFVSAIGTPRIALDVGDDAVFFDNPDLPNTRSEMALPLRIADEIIGVLDVQSIEENAFQEEDIEILSTLADQVAIAIQNSRTYQTMQELLEQAQRESGTYIQEAWHVLQSEQSTLGYRVAGSEVISLTKPLTSSQIKKAVESKQTVAESGEAATLAIPIRLRNEVIGVMDIRTPNNHEWDNDEVDIAEAVADRLSLALESSLLLKSTQRQAELERITASISGKISSTTQFDAIIRTAAEELSRALGGSDVLVQLRREQYDQENQ